MSCLAPGTPGSHKGYVSLIGACPAGSRQPCLHARPVVERRGRGAGALAFPNASLRNIWD
eukprot:1457411-Rhodomonas_salina.2